jgi:hypothetical protein
MFNVGVAELILVAVVAIPGLAFVATPIVVAVVLWKRQTELQRRVERLESTLRQQGDR